MLPFACIALMDAALHGLRYIAPPRVTVPCDIDSRRALQDTNQDGKLSIQEVAEGLAQTGTTSLS